MSDDEFAKVVKNLIKACENFRDERSQDRILAMEYYHGKMTDTPADAKRSQIVSRDVRAALNKVLPSIMRTILGNEKVVDYQPMKDGDAASAEQATDFVNFVVVPESRAVDAIQSAIHDALLLRNGILKWWYDKRVDVKVSLHTGLSDDELTALVADDDVTVLEHSQEQEMIAPGQPVNAHSVRIMRKSEEGCVKLAAVPLERFLIHPDATELECALAVGEHRRLTRSELVSMGYKKADVYSWPIAGGADAEEVTRRDASIRHANDEEASAQEVDYYEMYVHVDRDRDGIAELRRVCVVGGTDSPKLAVIDDQYWDEIQFADIVSERKPHQWEGVSLYDDLRDVQRIKTVLLRATLDNLYWQNKPQPIVQGSMVENPEALLNPGFGEPIRIKQGADVRQAVQFNPVPFVAKDSFEMLSYMDSVATDRTGINDAAAGMAPNALQNMTATATALIEQAGIGRADMIIRTIANGGLKRAFCGLLKLTIKHSDKERMARLRDEVVPVDPRSWDADMDATINVGLGTGTRERDMAAMGAVMKLQSDTIATLGIDNPFVKANEVYAAAARFITSAGIRTPSLYYRKPKPDEIEQFMAAMHNKPNPEMLKIQGQMQIAQQKMQIDAQLEQVKMQAQRDKEAAQAQADALVAERKAQIEADDREKDREIERMKIESNEAIEMAKLGLQRESAQADREADVQAEQTKVEPILGKLDDLHMAVASAQSRGPRRFVMNRDPTTGDLVGIDEMYGDAV